MKAGRNDPCPCGSGKKYKKCCLGQETEKAEDRYKQIIVNRPSRHSESLRHGLSAYAISKASEREDILARLPPKYRTNLADKWTPKKLRALETSEISERLSKLGLTVTPDSYLHEAEGKTSAWKIGEGWVIGLGRKLPVDDDDFVCQAACELWRRFCPVRPSVEMVDDWMQEGYEAASSIGMCDSWFKVWDYFKGRVTKEMTKPWDVDPLFVSAKRALWPGNPYP